MRMRPPLYPLLVTFVFHKTGAGRRDGGAKKKKKKDWSGFLLNCVDRIAQIHSGLV